MGKGIEAARALDPEAAAAIEEMRDQLLIVLLKRLGGKATVSVREMDNTGGDVMMMRLEGREAFHFSIEKKA